jgi:hypothetical protein
MMSLIAILGAAAIQPPATAVPDHVAMCYVQVVDLSKVNPTDPRQIITSGPKRFIAIEFPARAENEFSGASVKLHDPTEALLGRTVEKVLQDAQKGIFVFLTKGNENDSLLMTVNPPAPGRTTNSVLIARTIKGEPLTYTLMGHCSFVPTNEPNVTFEKLTKEPDIQP